MIQIRTSRPSGRIRPIRSVWRSATDRGPKQALAPAVIDADLQAMLDKIEIADLANDLRPHVGRGAGLVPSRRRQARPIFRPRSGSVGHDGCPPRSPASLCEFFGNGVREIGD